MTIQEVARRAGVSEASVSRALNNPQRVAPKTRERIMEVIRELNYTPNPLAQGLNTGRTKLVAMIVANLSNPYFAEVAEGCDQELRHTGYQMIITNTHQDAQLEAEALAEMRQRRVDGVILASAQNPIQLLAGFQPGMPLTIIGQTPAVKILFDSVVMDDYGGIGDTVRYLTARNYRDIACIAGPPEHAITQRRLRVLGEALAGAELQLRPDRTVHGEFHAIESGRTAMRRLLDSVHRPRAVIAMNDILAVGALRAIHESGLAIPGDIAVIGFDDIPLAANSWPSLTTVRTDTHEIGRQAARAVVNRIRHPRSNAQRLVVSAKLILRESC